MSRPWGPRVARGASRIRGRGQVRDRNRMSGADAAAPAEWVGVPRARRRAGLSIYSILLMMLLFVSVLSSIVVGVIGYINGTEALRAIAYERLVEIRENRAREVAELFTSIENSVRLGSLNETSVQAARAFSDGFQQLEAQRAGCRGIRPAGRLLPRRVRPPARRGERRGGRRRRRSCRSPRPRHTCRSSTSSPSPRGRRRSRSMTPATAARGRRRTPRTTSTTAR